MIDHLVIDDIFSLNITGESLQCGGEGPRAGDPKGQITI
jgi:hypothetical protein